MANNKLPTTFFSRPLVQKCQIGYLSYRNIGDNYGTYVLNLLKYANSSFVIMFISGVHEPLVAAEHETLFNISTYDQRVNHNKGMSSCELVACVNSCSLCKSTCINIYFGSKSHWHDRYNSKYPHVLKCERAFAVQTWILLFSLRSTSLII